MGTNIDSQNCAARVTYTIALVPDLANFPLFSYYFLLPQVNLLKATQEVTLPLPLALSLALPLTLPLLLPRPLPLPVPLSLLLCFSASLPLCFWLCGGSAG